MRAGVRRLPADVEIMTISQLVDRALNDDGLRAWEIATDGTWWNAHWAIRGSYRDRSDATLATAPAGLLILVRPAPDDDRPRFRWVSD